MREAPTGGVFTGTELLYRAHFSALMRVAFVLTGSNEVAEDLVHDVFLRCAGRLGDVDDPAAYLRASVVNACRSHQRHMAVSRRLDKRPEMADRDQGSELVELHDALAVLNSRRRAAVVLRYLCDLDDSEIGEILDCRPATVRSLLRRGLAQLREALP